MTDPSAAPSVPPALLQELAEARSVKQTRAIVDRWLSAAPPQVSASDRSAAPAAVRDVVGIWRRQEEHGESVFVRDTTIEDDMFWADVERIGPKRGRRIVLLGESVARGAFSDPLFTCKSALDAYLAHA